MTSEQVFPYDDYKKLFEQYSKDFDFEYSKIVKKGKTFDIRYKNSKLYGRYQDSDYSGGSMHIDPYTFFHYSTLVKKIKEYLKIEEG